MKKHSNFVKNTVMQYLMIVAQYIFPLITFPYMTRILETEAYGVHTYMTSVVTYFQLFVDFGFILSSTEQISKHRDEKDYVQKVFSETVYAKGLLFLASVIILTILIPFQPILSEYRLISYLYLGTVFFSVFLADYLFRGIEKMEVLTYRFVASKFVSMTLTFILVKDSGDLIWVPILNAAGSLVSVIWTWIYIYVKLGYQYKQPTIIDSFKQIKKSTVYFVSNIATTAFGAFTTLVMGFSLTATQIAFWGTSYNLITTVQSLYSPITNSLFPHMVKEHDVKLTNKVLLIFMPVIVVGCLVCLFGSKIIFTIMCGESYFDAIPTFRFLIPVLLFSFPAMVIGFPVLGAFGYTKDVTKSTVITAIYHIFGILGLYLMGQFTIENIAVLRSTTELLLLIIRMVYCEKYGLLRRAPRRKENEKKYVN